MRSAVVVKFTVCDSAELRFAVRTTCKAPQQHKEVFSLHQTIMN